MNKTFLGLLISVWFTSLQAQLPTINIPVSSQKAVIIQTIGVTEIKVTYHRPQVNNREIWGSVVPFSNNAPFPWRAGDRETTLIEFSHDVKIETKDLSAGKYGIHMLIHNEEDATVIFSKTFNSWGSFTYKQDDDALRVDVKIKEIQHHEWLTYEFVDPMPNHTYLTLMWGKKAIPIRIDVDVPNIAMADIEYQLEGIPGGIWQNTLWAARYLASVGKEEKALELANTGVSQATLFTPAIIIQTNILYSLNRNEEADKIMTDFLSGPNATAQVVYQHGRRLIRMNREDEALALYNRQKDKFPDHYLTSLGLARVYSKRGEYKKSIKYVNKAKADFEKIPPNFQTNVTLSSFERYIKTLQSNKDFN